MSAISRSAGRLPTRGTATPPPATRHEPHVPLRVWSGVVSPAPAAPLPPTRLAKHVGVARVALAISDGVDISGGLNQELGGMSCLEKQ